MAYNYSWNDSPAPVTPSNISSLPLGVQKNPPTPPHMTGRGIDPNGLDFSVFDDNSGGVTGPSGPVPATPAPPGGAGSLWSLLGNLFSGRPSAQGQGMSGLIRPGGRGSPGTNALGNPFNRF
jgi:hypothetical protein